VINQASFKSLSEILWWESVIVHITVLSTRRKGKSIRRKVCRMHRTEMAFNLHEFIAKNYVVDFHLEATC